MHNVYIIGDSHSTEIFEYHNFDDPKINLKVWGAGGGNILNFDALGYKSGNTVSVEFEKIQWPKPISFKDVKDDGLILSWFGYIDAKHYLPKYPEHIDKIVIKYIKNLKENFPNSVIKIIEPHPQFVSTGMKNFEGLTLYDYETRKTYNKKLCESLRKHSLELGLGETITQDKIYQSTGLNEFTIDNVEEYTDGLKYKYRTNIYNMLIKEIYGILGIE